MFDLLKLDPVLSTPAGGLDEILTEAANCDCMNGWGCGSGGGCKCGTKGGCGGGEPDVSIQQA